MLQADGPVPAEFDELGQHDADIERAAVQGLDAGIELPVSMAKNGGSAAGAWVSAPACASVKRVIAFFMA